MIAPRISYSDAQNLANCPKRYALGFTAVLPSFQSSLHLGLALHNAAARAADITHRTGTVPGIDEIAPIFTTALNTLPLTRDQPTRQTLETLFEDGLPKLEVFLNVIAPRLRQMKRLETEKWVQVNLDDGTNQVIVTGRIDLMFFDPMKSRLVILDLKTGRAPEEHGSNPQLAGYIAATRADPAIIAEFGPDIRIDAFAVYLESPMPIFHAYDQDEHLQADLAYFVQSGTRAAAMTEFPANHSSACAYCGYFEHCHPDHGKPSNAVVTA